MATLAELGEIAKSEIMPGVFRSITHNYSGKHYVNRPVRDAVAARVRGDLVHHGGEVSRIKRLIRGKPVDTSSGTGSFQSGGYGKGKVFTTLSHRTAEGYGVAGRTPKAYARHGDIHMNSRIVPRGHGAIASFNMKGVWPKGVQTHGGNAPTELLYSPEQLRAGYVKGSYRGVKPHRTQIGREEARIREEGEARRAARGELTRSQQSDVARKAILRGEKTPNQLLDEEFDARMERDFPGYTARKYGGLEIEPFASSQQAPLRRPGRLSRIRARFSRKQNA